MDGLSEVHIKYFSHLVLIMSDTVPLSFPLLLLPLSTLSLLVSLSLSFFCHTLPQCHMTQSCEYFGDKINLQCLLCGIPNQIINKTDFFNGRIDWVFR